jgi:hypothetical protein
MQNGKYGADDAMMCVWMVMVLYKYEDRHTVYMHSLIMHKTYRG